MLTSSTSLDTGKYLLNVSVTDGKYSNSAPVRIAVDSLDEDMLNEAVSIRYVDDVQVIVIRGADESLMYFCVL